jgi:hypothetical protein
MYLCKNGWFGGNPVQAYNSPVDLVLQAYWYEKACGDYETAYFEMNKDKKE